jgi:hypothetical protein
MSGDFSMAQYNETVMDFLRSQDEREVDLGDTFDIKTSIALVILIFLATQSADFLKMPLSFCWHIIQQLSVAFLVIAATLALIELIPRDYHLRMAPDAFLNWADQVKASYKKSDVPDPESGAIAHIRDVEIKKLKDRFTANSSVNAKKSWLVNWSFRAMTLAVILNLLTLAYVSFGR